VISAVEVLIIHDRVIASTGGSLGIRDEGGLLSAVGRPFQTFGGEDLYPSVFEKAGALLHSLCSNHPFVDGNKRTALVAAAFLLHQNGIELDVPIDEGESFMLRVAQGDVDAAATAAQLEAWAVQTR
jgi:death on curing protein